MDKKQTKTILRKTWYFLWESNSIWSWIANIIIAFILIKFIVFPVLGFVLSTSHPIVAVVSSSMEHDYLDFDEWWLSFAVCEGNPCIQRDFYYSHNISKKKFMTFKYKDGFNTGDIMVLKGTDPKNIDIGDILVFNKNRPAPIIHRVIKKWEENGEYFFKTKGDHNFNPISSESLNETKISSDEIVGKAFLRIPYLGWIKILFVKMLQFLRII